jgi:hypothetical protein
MAMHRGMKIARFALFALAALAVLSFVVLHLWNWLMPALFGLHAITFWQSAGLLVLSKILLGGFRGGPRRRLFWRRRMMARWEKMTPEEREKFRQGMHSCGGPFGPAVANPKP